MKNKVFVLAAFAVVALAFIALMLTNKSSQSSEAGATRVQTPAASSEARGSAMPVFVRPHSYSSGAMMAKVTVAQWFDPECESCRAIHPAYKKLVAEYKDRVHFVLRYMPYHGNSLFAASALEEAREFGKFDEALDILFEKQPEWGDHHQPRPELIVSYLTALGIPKDKLGREYLTKKHGEKISIDEKDGKSAGIRGTPTFFVNGQMVQELGERPLREAIEAALKM